MPKEASVQVAAADVEASRVAGASGTISAETLQRQVDLHFASLAGCRLEVARKKQITLDAVTAGRMALRWTILPTGRTAATEVVPLEQTDLLLLDCIKRRMSFWEFTRPHGGAVRVSRPFALR
jgi:hypothetical protein